MAEQHPAKSTYTGTTTRRTVVTCAGCVALAVAVPGCSKYGESSTPATAPPAGTALAKASEIPVGGGKVFEQAKVVVTQPVQGTFRCFTAVCTHQGCVVAGVDGGTINCGCHGSRFKLDDGSVAGGPATSPLAAQQITVTGDSIQLGDGGPSSSQPTEQPTETESESESETPEPSKEETTAQGAVLARTAEIPVGGGKVLGDAQVVVTQPKKGTFKCFTAVCTHQGCTVADVAGGTINCGCHGSKFDIADGSVARSPARRPLAAKKITVKDGAIRLA